MNRILWKVSYSFEKQFIHLWICLICLSKVRHAVQKTAVTYTITWLLRNILYKRIYIFIDLQKTLYDTLYKNWKEIFDRFINSKTHGTLCIVICIRAIFCSCNTTLSENHETSQFWVIFVFLRGGDMLALSLVIWDKVIHIMIFPVVWLNIGGQAQSKYLAFF